VESKKIKEIIFCDENFKINDKKEYNKRKGPIVIDIKKYEKDSNGVI
jgi:hypothetical protein